MKYEIISIESMGEIFKHVIIAREDGSFESFPVDEANARYQQYLIDTDDSLPKPPAKSTAPADSTTTK